MNAMQDLSVSHLHGYNGVTEKIKRAMYESAKQFVYIGFLLREVKEYKYYEEGSYKDVYEYAEFELGFKRSSTKNFIAIAETFGVQEYTYGGKLHKEYKMCLQPKYEKFNYSQLVELLAMSDQQRNKAKPDMTVKQLREIKKAPIVEQVTMDELEAKAIGQTSGQKTGEIACTVNNYWKDLNKTDVKEICFMTGKRYNTKSNYTITITPIAKNKEKQDLKRRLCEAAGIEFDPANFDYGIKMELMDK